MREQTALSVTPRELNPMVASAATLAAGLIRSISIKHYAPVDRQQEFDLLASKPELHLSRSRIYREKGAGGYPTIVLGGFVPDATEAVEFQRGMLRRHGSIYYINYPRNGFCREMLAAQLGDLLHDLKRKGQKPMVMGISFGCGLLLDYLAAAPEAIHERVRGILLISPVICTDDLIRPVHEKQGGIRFLESNLKKLLAANPERQEELEKHIERSRRCFQALFNSGAENRSLGVRHLAIRSKIMDVINKTPCRGGFERMAALRELSFPSLNNSIFAGPVLTLLAENELDILVPTSPTMRLFRDQQSYARLFPRCLVRTVRSADPLDGVAHASMIFHHQAYNELIDGWYSKLLYPRLQLAV